VNIEDQVVSHVLSKKLKELGVKQSSLFYWTIGGTVYRGDMTFYLPENYSAFTVAEIGDMLPKAIQVKTEEEEKKIFSNFRLVTGRSLIIDEDKPYEFWSVNYICDTTNEFRNWLFDTLLTKAIYDRNEANCRAKMLIHLIENGLK